MPRELVALKNWTTIVTITAAMSAAVLTTSPAFAEEGIVQPPQAIVEARAALQDAWDTAPLGFTTATFTQAPANGYGDYTPVASANFQPDQPIYVYTEPVGYAFREDDGRYIINLSVDFELRNMTGQILASRTNFAQLENASRRRVHEFQTSLQFGLLGLQQGDYVLQVRINDLNSEKTGSFELPFTMAGQKN